MEGMGTDLPGSAVKEAFGGRVPFNLRLLEAVVFRAALTPCDNWTDSSAPREQPIVSRNARERIRSGFVILGGQSAFFGIGRGGCGTVFDTDQILDLLGLEIEGQSMQFVTDREYFEIQNRHHEDDAEK